MQCRLCAVKEISIHALREEGDQAHCRRDQDPMISIHALREEGDLSLYLRLILGNDFYPRPPRGGRPFSASASLMAFVFLSTPSARRATPAFPASAWRSWISIHALREEGDPHDYPVRDRNFISIHALLAEGVDRNMSAMANQVATGVSPSSRRAWIEIKFRSRTG